METEKKVNKVFLCGGAYQGCWYVRMFLPMSHNGWTGNYLGVSKNLKPAKVVEQEMMKADVVVFHRADTVEHHKMAMMLKGMGKKIVFDNDDTYQLDENHPFWGLDEKGFEQNKERLNNIINNFIRNADLVTCSTEYLAKEYQQLNPNVVVLKNCVEPSDWDTPLRNTGEKIRVGLTGSTAYAQDFEMIRKLLLKLSKDERVQLVVFGLPKDDGTNPKTAEVHKKEFGFLKELGSVEHVPWVEMENYFTQLNELRLDMMLIPRRENHFNKAKSNLKFLEAGMLEIPVIAQSFPDAPYEKDIDGTNGILVKTQEEWANAVEELITNKKKRRALGKAAHKYVVANYNIADHAHLWEEAYQTLL